ncbi:non-homologous end-joining DNA ligase [Candidatus Binatia bacterium]|nr:non-homologous end-joining DNA ligase [Candidatus Binatia bacterium]
MAKEEARVLEVAGREVRITNPSKPYFSEQARLTKLELVAYYLSVADGALNGIRDRPIVLKRFVDGAHAEAFYQKRAPESRPEWIRTVTLSFPSGRTAEEVVVDDAAGLAWIVNLGCIELHPHPVLSGDLDHPNELRVDLDPTPGVAWDDVRRVALEVKALLEELGLTGWPKTSGSRGMHVNVRIQPRWTFTEVRRAALALSREIERRVPDLATSKWWKEERHGVFLDYNQNAKDRTTCSAYSVRPLPDARVSTPLTWDEVPDCDAADFTVATVPARFAAIGDPHAEMDHAPGSLDMLLELAERDEAQGLGDAPWPPHYRKMEGEGARVAPSRARKAKPADGERQDGDVATGVKKKRTASRTPRTKMPLVTVANSPDKAAALDGLERWKARHPEAASHVTIEDVLVDSMRGRSSTWTRVRVNLRHVPEELRPQQETPDPDDDPTR